MYLFMIQVALILYQSNTINSILRLLLLLRFTVKTCQLVFMVALFCTVCVYIRGWVCMSKYDYKFFSCYLKLISFKTKLEIRSGHTFFYNVWYQLVFLSYFKTCVCQVKLIRCCLTQMYQYSLYVFNLAALSTNFRLALVWYVWEPRLPSFCLKSDKFQVFRVL